MHPPFIPNAPLRVPVPMFIYCTESIFHHQTQSFDCDPSKQKISFLIRSTLFFYSTDAAPM